MQATNRLRKILTALSVVLIAAALIGAAGSNPAKETVSAAPVAAVVQTPGIGVATGEYQNGVRVYRMPSIAVTVSRNEALARITREDSLAMK